MLTLIAMLALGQARATVPYIPDPVNTALTQSTLTTLEEQSQRVQICDNPQYRSFTINGTPTIISPATSAQSAIEFCIPDHRQHAAAEFAAITWAVDPAVPADPTSSTTGPGITLVRGGCLSLNANTTIVFAVTAYNVGGTGTNTRLEVRTCDFVTQ